MAITVDELQAMVNGGDTDRTPRIEGILKAINSSGCFRRPEIDGMMKAINSSGVSYYAFQIASRHQRAAMGIPLASLAKAHLAAFDPATLSASAAAKVMESSYDSYSTLQAGINQLIQTDLHRCSSVLSQISAAIPDFDVFRRAQQTMAQFFGSQSELSLNALEPLRSYYAELACDVNSVTVDISHGARRVVRAEYDRKNAVELLSAIILLKDLRTKSAYKVQDGQLNSEELFNCLDDHDTHYAEYLGDVTIKTKGDDESKTLTDWFQELKETGQVDEDRLEETQYLAYRAERFFRRNFGTFFYSGLLVLAEASVCHVLEHPVSAEEHRDLERMIGEPLRRLLPKPSRGGNTRGGTAWKKVPPRTFAKKVDELYDTADLLLNGYNLYKSNTDWFDMLKLSDRFKLSLRNCSGDTLDQVALLIPVRLQESRSKNRRHSSTPLALACELAARELLLKKKDGGLYGAEYLLRKYREGGGLRGKHRRQKSCA